MPTPSPGDLFSRRCGPRGFLVRAIRKRPYTELPNVLVFSESAIRNDGHCVSQLENHCMKPVPRLTALLLGAGLLASLAGCDLAEESANKLAEKAEAAAQEIAREAIGEAVNELNKKVDEAQASAKELLGEQQQNEAREEPRTPSNKNEGKEEDAMLPPSGVET